MKVLLTAFYGKYNASNMLVDMIDDNVDKGRKATAHANIDGKIILYSNVQTKGY